MGSRAAFGGAFAFFLLIIKIAHVGKLVTDILGINIDAAPATSDFVPYDVCGSRNSYVPDSVPYDVPSPIDDKDVVILSERNFSKFIAENQYVVVNFYAPWCSGSQQLAPEYGDAATMLKGKAVLAKVDVTMEKDLARKSRSRRYSFLQIYVGGFLVENYCGKPDRDSITTWVNSIVNHNSYTLTTRDEAEAAKQELASQPDSFFYLGFFNSLQDKEAQEFAAASKLNRDLKFYQTADFDVVSELYGFHTPTIRPALLLVVKRDGKIKLGIHPGDDVFNRSTLSMIVLKDKGMDTPQGAKNQITQPMRCFKDPYASARTLDKATTSSPRKALAGSLT